METSENSNSLKSIGDAKSDKNSPKTNNADASKLEASIRISARKTKGQKKWVFEEPDQNASVSGKRNRKSSVIEKPDKKASVIDKTDKKALVIEKTDEKTSGKENLVKSSPRSRKSTKPSTTQQEPKTKRAHKRKATTSHQHNSNSIESATLPDAVKIGNYHDHH